MGVPFFRRWENSIIFTQTPKGTSDWGTPPLLVVSNPTMCGNTTSGLQPHHLWLSGQHTWTKIILPAWILWWMHTKKHRRCYPQGMALSRTCLTEPPPEANRGTSSPPCTRSKISCHARIYESLVSTHATGTPSPASIFGKTPCKARMLDGVSPCEELFPLYPHAVTHHAVQECRKSWLAN